MSPAPGPLEDAAVVVVNYGSSLLLRQNLVGVEDLVGQVVVVDNFSAAEERAQVLELGRAHGWDVLTPPDNSGFGAGTNSGVARALSRGARSLVLLNPDATVDHPSLHALTDFVERHPRAIAAPRILKPDGAVWSPGLMVVDLADGRTRSARSHAAAGGGGPVMTWLSGACLAISANLWRELDGFDEEYFLYWEDVDLCVRATSIGAQLSVVDEAVAIHDEGGTHASTAGPAKSATYYYYTTRNRLLFADKHLPAGLRRRWRWSAPAAACEIVLRGGRRQLLHSLTPWWAPLRGTFDGLRASRRPGRPARAPHRPRPTRER